MEPVGSAEGSEEVENVTELRELLLALAEGDTASDSTAGPDTAGLTDADSLTLALAERLGERVGVGELPALADCTGDLLTEALAREEADWEGERLEDLVASEERMLEAVPPAAREGESLEVRVGRGEALLLGACCVGVGEWVALTRGEALVEALPVPEAETEGLERMVGEAVEQGEPVCRAEGGDE